MTSSTRRRRRRRHCRVSKAAAAAAGDATNHEDGRSSVVVIIIRQRAQLQLQLPWLLLLLLLWLGPITASTTTGAAYMGSRPCQLGRCCRLLQQSSFSTSSSTTTTLALTTTTRRHSFRGPIWSYGNNNNNDNSFLRRSRSSSCSTIGWASTTPTTTTAAEDYESYSRCLLPTSDKQLEDEQQQQMENERRAILQESQEYAMVDQDAYPQAPAQRQTPNWRSKLVPLSFWRRQRKNNRKGRNNNNNVPSVGGFLERVIEKWRTPPPPGKLILLLNGESTWHANGTFTGWDDPPLTEKGRVLCQHAARLLIAEGLLADVVYTSRLTRAIQSVHEILNEWDAWYLPVMKTYRLNARMYGAVQGLSKNATAATLGANVVQAWRNTLKARPPPLSYDDPSSPIHDRRYQSLLVGGIGNGTMIIPQHESLLDCQERARPVWEHRIRNEIAAGHTVLVVAHQDALRGLIKAIDHISNDDILNVVIPPGVPLVYRFAPRTLQTGSSSSSSAKDRRRPPHCSGMFLQPHAGLLAEALEKQTSWQRQYDNGPLRHRHQVHTWTTVERALWQLRRDEQLTTQLLSSSSSSSSASSSSSSSTAVMPTAAETALPTAPSIHVETTPNMALPDAISHNKNDNNDNNAQHGNQPPLNDAKVERWTDDPRESEENSFFHSNNNEAIEMNYNNNVWDAEENDNNDENYFELNDPVEETFEYDDRLAPAPITEIAAMSSSSSNSSSNSSGLDTENVPTENTDLSVSLVAAAPPPPPPLPLPALPSSTTQLDPMQDPVVVFVRHGRTPHNNLGLFTGFQDPPLASEGVQDARRAGRLLKRHGFQFDVVYTSQLTRAIQTATYILEELGTLWLPIVKSWRLNERMYGALTGKSKRMIENEYGKEQLLKWRRGYKIRPPPVSSFSPDYPGNDERRTKYIRDLPISWSETIARSLEQRKWKWHRKFPKTESLHDCMQRSIPFYTQRIVTEAVSKQKRVLIAGHENAIRGILMHLCDIPEEAMQQLHIPNGLPLVYNVKAKCITLLQDDDDDLNDTDGQQQHHHKVTVEDFGPAAKYLFRPCELTDDFYESMAATGAAAATKKPSSSSVQQQPPASTAATPPRETTANRGSR